MKRKLYFYTNNQTKPLLKDITKNLFCDYFSKENYYIWESNLNIDNIPNSFWLSGNYSSPKSNQWHIPIISKEELNKIESNSENIKYLTWNIKQNEIYYKITLIDFTNKNDGRGYVIVVTLHFQDENYAFIYENPYFSLENVYLKNEKEFKDVLFLNKSFGSNWITSVNYSRIHSLLKETSKKENYINDFKDILFKLSNLKYKIGKENSNEKEYTQYVTEMDKIDKGNGKSPTISHFSHYRQLTHFVKQNYWNKYDEFKPNKNVVELINGEEFPLNKAYHPIKSDKMIQLKELKTNDELQEDLFYAWQTAIFKNNPYK